jgi:hypothetical protein
MAWSKRKPPELSASRVGDEMRPTLERPDNR